MRVLTEYKNAQMRFKNIPGEVRAVIVFQIYPNAFTRFEPIESISPAFVDLMALVEPNGLNTASTHPSPVLFASLPVIAAAKIPVTKSVVPSPIIDLFDPIKQLSGAPGVAEDVKLPRSASKKSLASQSLNSLSVSLSLPRTISSEGMLCLRVLSDASIDNTIYAASANSLASTPTAPTSPSTPFITTPSEPRSPGSPRSQHSLDTNLFEGTSSKKQPSGPRLPLPALSEYTPSQKDEMMITLGDSISILVEFSDGWALGRNESTGERGVFPLAVFEESSSSDDLDEDEDVADVSSIEHIGEGAIQGHPDTDESISGHENDSSEEEQKAVMMGEVGKPPLPPIMGRIRPDSISSNNAGTAAKRSSAFGYIWNTITARTSPGMFLKRNCAFLYSVSALTQISNNE